MVDGEYKPTSAARRPTCWDFSDGQVKTVRAILAARTDAELMSTWTFKQNGQELFGMPRAAAWRSFVMSHLIHHRGS